MPALKAFIGHSFSAPDKELVRSFLEFFEQIKGMNIGFSWEHAEAAEAKELADKVLGLMQDKNLFIGICTKNEKAISSDELKPTLFRENLKARKDLFEPKTSDWIIQEIGLAIGKGMDLILLVESGVRQPGGLQGNKEYIAFDRHSPEKAFGKVLEMIQSLIPKAKTLTKIDEEVRTAPEEKGDEPSQENDWLKPEQSWKRNDFEHAMWRAILFEDKNSEQAIDQAYLATEEGRNVQKRESWHAYRELISLRFGKGGQLTTLDQLATDHPHNTEILKYRAQGYQDYGEEEKAAQYFEVAAQEAGSQLEKLRLLGQAARAFASATRREQCQRTIEQMKSTTSVGEDGELSLLSTLRDVAKIEKSDDAYCSLTERILDLRPSDIDLRFELAYKYSERGFEDLSLYHYLKIPYLERTPMTWNNLGVQFDHFELVSQSVDAYRNSEAHDETLAMSNLANKFLKAGFLKEAEEICNRAIKIKDYHKNVGSTISRIRGMPEIERIKLEEIQQKAIPVSDFFKNYGYALAKETVGNHQGRWQGNKCELSITIKGDSFMAEGSYELLSYDSLAGLLIGQPASPTEKTIYTVRYEGTIQGKAVRATYKKTSDDEPSSRPTILGGTMDSGKPLFMIFSDSLEEIQIYEKTEKENTFYKFARLI